MTSAVGRLLSAGVNDLLIVGTISVPAEDGGRGNQWYIRLKSKGEMEIPAADGKCVRLIVQWHLPVRVSGHELVPVTAQNEADDRSMEAGLQ